MNLAIDLGSSSCRVMLLNKTTGGFSYEELARFMHTAIKTDKGYRWDIENLFKNIMDAIDKAIVKYNIEKIGICGWGVDYGVLRNGELIDLPYCYRDERNLDAFEKVHSIISKEEYYSKTGIYPNPINTIYQLYADKLSNRYDSGVTLLMIPDLLAYFLTGNMYCEISNASTTGLLSLNGKEWNCKMLTNLGLHCTILPELIECGNTYGKYKGCDVIACCTHDTASAVYSMDTLNNNSIFISSGSWLLVGKLLETPVTSDEAYKGFYTNERGFDGKVTFLNNVNGLFLIQRLVSELGLNYRDIDDCMNLSKSLGILNVDELGSMDDMSKSILKQLNIKSADPYDLVKTVYDSLAFRIHKAIVEVEKITNQKIIKIVMTGGACKAKYLCEKITEICNVELEFGYNEGAVIGIAKVLFS